MEKAIFLFSKLSTFNPSIFSDEQVHSMLLNIKALIFSNNKKPSFQKTILHFVEEDQVDSDGVTSRYPDISLNIFLD
jgi:hypothetical protein